LKNEAKKAAVPSPHPFPLPEFTAKVGLQALRRAMTRTGIVPARRLHVEEPRPAIRGHAKDTPCPSHGSCRKVPCGETVGRTVHLEPERRLRPQRGPADEKSRLTVAPALSRTARSTAETRSPRSAVFPPVPG